MNILRSPLSFAVGLGAVLAVASPAWATSPQDQAAAEVLFQQAKALADAGDWQNACPKFLESQRLDAGAGTLLNLGACYERINKLASAWGAFKEAELAAANAGDSKGRSGEAARRAALLEPRLSRLSIVVPAAARVPALRVTRDGEAVGEGQWGSPLPIDSGEHVVEATAPGRRTWTSKLVIGGPGVTTAEVPQLAEGPTEASAVVPLGSGGSVQKSLGFAGIGVGGASLLVGAITLGLDASKNATLARQCPLTHCAPSLQADINSYHTLGIVSSTSFIVGGALAATGLIVVLTTPKADPHPVSVSPLVGLGYAGLAGRF